MRSLLMDKRGNFYTTIIVVIILFVVDIMYLVVAYATNSFFDKFDSVGSANVYTSQLEATLRYVGPTVIVVLNIGLVVYLVVSAWKRGSNEAPEELLM